MGSIFVDIYKSQIKMEAMPKGRNRNYSWSSYDRHFRALNEAPSMNTVVQARYLETVKKMSEVLAPVGLAKPPSKVYLGHSRSAAAGRLRWVLDTCYAQGMLDGLRDGWRLHIFGINLERDPRHRYIVQYLRKHPKKEDRTDEKICMYLDAQIDRLANMDEHKKPVPLRKWRNDSWAQALKDKTKTGKRNRVCDSVMSYLTFCRQLQESKDVTLLNAWKDLARETAEGARKLRAIREKYAKPRRLIRTARQNRT